MLWASGNNGNAAGLDEPAAFFVYSALEIFYLELKSADLPSLEKSVTCCSA
jgi:hypothetical protein